MEDISNEQSVYHPRRPYDSPLWRLLDNHYENFERCYEERFEQKYGFFRPVIREVVRNYLTCGEMKIVSFITDQEVIRQILKHLGLWIPAPSRDPPNTTFSPKNHELVYEIFDDLSVYDAQADGWPGYDESCIAQN